MAKTPEEISVTISKEEKTILKLIYDHRTLTEKQITQLIFGPKEILETDISACKRHLINLIKLGALEEQEHLLGIFYKLTTIGVNTLRICYDLPTNIYDQKRRIVKRGYYRAGELAVANRFLNHQHSLNEFMVAFRALEHDIVWKYYDEKHISSFNNIRPDGLLNVMDIDFFIEIDMNTETSNQLYDKWDGYRRFMKSKEYVYSERKIIVLFVIENAVNPQTRINLVKHTIKERILDRLDSNFEIYVDTKENLIALIDKMIKEAKDQIISDNEKVSRALATHGFSVANGELISRYLNNNIFEYYIRMIDEKNNIIVKGNKLQEYLVDYYFDGKMSVLQKIMYLDSINTFFSSTHHRELSYIVIVDDIEKLYKDLQLMDLINSPNVYYTTIRRLNEAENFKKALIQFDAYGNVYHFKDNGLQFKQLEMTLCNEQ